MMWKRDATPAALSLFLILLTSLAAPLRAEDRAVGQPAPVVAAGQTEESSLPDLSNDWAFLGTVTVPYKQPLSPDNRAVLLLVMVRPAASYEGGRYVVELSYLNPGQSLSFPPRITISEQAIEEFFRALDRITPAPDGAVTVLNEWSDKLLKATSREVSYPEEVRREIRALVHVGQQWIQARGTLATEKKPGSFTSGGSSGSSGPVYVHGYYRKDGTYVRPHYRRRPRR
jgi:hypothetical protein